MLNYFDGSGPTGHLQATLIVRFLILSDHMFDLDLVCALSLCTFVGSCFIKKSGDLRSLDRCSPWRSPPAWFPRLGVPAEKRLSGRSAKSYLDASNRPTQRTTSLMTATFSGVSLCDCRCESTSGNHRMLVMPLNVCRLPLLKMRGNTFLCSIIIVRTWAHFPISGHITRLPNKFHTWIRQ